MKNVSFAVVEGDVIDATEDSDRFEFTVEETENDCTFGTYSYESPAMFGSPKTATNEFVRHERGLFGLVTEHDVPKPKSMFQSLAEHDGVIVDSPHYPASAAHDFYRTYGFNGYTVEFQSSLNTLNDRVVSTIDPEEEMKKRAQSTRRSTSEELLEEIVEEYMEKQFYVTHMDISLDASGKLATFSNPLHFGSINDDEWNRDTFFTVVDRALELWTDNVQTFEEFTGN